MKEYDPTLRKKMGAYYTPTPVVRFIIREVDRILKEDFDIAEGIASSEMVDREIETQPWRLPGERKDRTTKQIKSHRVQILDPAVGTATFLNETIKYIYEQKRETQAGIWPSYVKEHLVPRLFGFELMMAPYTIAHLKLGMTLQETGVKDLGDERLNIYLTNTLEEGVPLQNSFDFGLSEAISTESRLAADIKTTQPIMIVMGNPPYSGVSSNETKYANSLIQKYKVEPGGQQKLQERKHWLNDDYVKFIAFAEDMIAKNGSGVMAMITNNGYLDNPTFRGMRWHLSQTFDKIYVLDLHGNAKKKEVAPNGGKDENVFNIMQGVSIILAVKTHTQHDFPATVNHAELYGLRKNKLTLLSKLKPEWTQLDANDKTHTFIEKDTQGTHEYDMGIALNELFQQTSAGLVTARDKIVIDFSNEQLLKRINHIADLRYSDTDIRGELFPGREDGKYLAGDTRGWQLSTARRAISTNSHENFCQKISYRPFDTRYIYYSATMVDWGREKIMTNFLAGPNTGLCFERGGLVGKNPFLVTNEMVPNGYSFSNTASIVYVAPLYIYLDGHKYPNFSETHLQKLILNLGHSPQPTEIVDYIYAVLYSPTFQDRFAAQLRENFPRIPIPTQKEFDRLTPQGRRLRELHLMESGESHEISTTFPHTSEEWKNEVNAPVYSKDVREPNGNGRVYINSQQYFGNVPEPAWNFYIGGYQPAQKWLKDRKGRKLTSDDITYYQRIITILTKTQEIMQEIG